jgi:hypothetical protein
MCEKGTLSLHVFINIKWCEESACPFCSLHVVHVLMYYFDHDTAAATGRPTKKPI